MGAVAQQVTDNLDDVDRLPRDHRLIVHEFGYAIYRALIAVGVREPRAMRFLVTEIWRGARGSMRSGKPRGFSGENNLAQLDWLLIQSGSNIPAATLLRVLRQYGLVVVPIEPSPQMVEASIETVRNHDMVLTKPRKHAMRLRAAIEAGANHYWPFLKKASP